MAGPQLGIRLEPEILDAWSKVAERLGKNPTGLARQVLTEFIACHASQSELREMKLFEYFDGDVAVLKFALKNMAAKADRGKEAKPVGEDRRFETLPTRSARKRS